MAPTMTLTEQRLCRMWAAAAFGGDFFELNKTLWEIAMILRAEGMAERTEDFALCAQVALQRAIDEISERKMKVAA